MNPVTLRRAFVTLVSVAALATAAQAADDLTGPLRVSPDGHFLTQPDGKPFFWLGENAWDLFQRLDREEIERYLADRAQKGFNVLLAVAGGVDPGPNRYGETFLIDDDPARPNPKYFDNVGWIIDRAAHHGIRIAMVTVWASCDGFGGAGSQVGKVLNPSNAEAYGRWLGERYRGQGIIWILGGDSNPLWPERGFAQNGRTPIKDYRPLYDAMARGLNEGNGAPAFITYHPSCCSYPGTAVPRTSLYLGNRAWLTINMLQTSHYAHPPEQVDGAEVGFDFGWRAPFNYEPIAAEYHSTPTRPVVDGEALFEDLGIDNDARNVATKGYWTGTDSLRAAYHAVFAGAAGQTYGNHSIWQFYDPARNTPAPPARLDLPWQKALERPVSSQLRYLKALMLSRPYFSRIPDQSLIVGDAGEGLTHISGTRDQDGRYAMIFLPRGQGVTVDLRKIAGPRVIGWWFNPRTGEVIRLKGAFETSGPKGFTPPTRCAQCDWVLVIDNESQRFNAPGTSTGPAISAAAQ